MKKSVYLIGIIGVLALSLSACDPSNPRESEGAKKEAQATNTLMNQAATVVGIPGVQNFTEKRQLKMLYELRDQADLVTYSYYTDWNGQRHKICPTTSVGFGMPFSAQFTAPSRDKAWGSGATETIMQPEPNGLYMPDSTSATWVICLGSDGKTLKPAYIEQPIQVYLEPMH